MAKKINLTKEQIEAAAKAGREKTEKAYAEKANIIAKGYPTSSKKTAASGSSNTGKKNQFSGKRTTGDGATRVDQVMAAAINSTLSAFQKLAADNTSSTGSLSMGESARAAINEAKTAKKEGRQVRPGQAQRKAEQDKIKSFNDGWAGDFKQKLLEGAQKSAESAYESERHAKEGLGKFGQGVVDFGIAGAQFASDALLNAVAPGAGLAAMAGRAYGSASLDAQQRGLSEGEQQISGLKSAAIEMLTEKLFGSVSKVAYGKGIIRNESLVNSLVNRLAKTDRGRTALKVLVGANEEGMEEVLSDILNPIADRILKLDDGKGDWSDLADDFDTQQMLEDYIIGGALGLVGAGTNVVSGQYRAENAQQRAYEEYQRQLVNAGLATEQGGDAQLTAEKYKNILDQSTQRGKRNLSDKETANLERLMTIGTDTQTVRDMLAQSGVLVDDNTAQAAALAASGQKLSSTQNAAIGNAAVQDAINQMAGNGVVDNIRRTAANEYSKPIVINSMARQYEIAPEVVERTYNLNPTAPQAFETAFNAVYQMGQQGTDKAALSKVPVLSTAQANIAYQMGADSVMRTETTAPVTNNNTQEVNDNGVRIHNVAERINGQNTEGQIRGVETGTGENVAGRSQKEQGGAGAAQIKTGEKVSYKGKQQKGVYYAAEDTEDMKKGRKLAESYGYKVTYFVGGNIRYAGGEFRGVVDTANKTVMVRADHPDYTAEQIMRHEMGHAAFENGDLSIDEAREMLLDEFTADEINELIEIYNSEYGGILSAEEAFEEICCDALGRMNIFEGTDLNSKSYWKAQDTVRKYAAERTGSKGRAPPKKGGVKYSYAGKHARTADLEQLERAKQMQTQGADMESIRKATGWLKGRDGKWRFEINDSRMQLRTDAANIPNYTTLGELVDAPELFEAYPDMADLSVTFHTLEGGQNGGYSRKFDSIELSRDLKNRPEALLNSLIHEVQHAIQNREGFASGANPAYWNRRMENGFDSRTAEERREGARLQEQYEQIRESDPQFVAAMEELDAMAPKVPRGKVDPNTWEQIEPDPPEWVRYDERRDQLEEQYGDRVWDWYSLRDSIDRNARNGGRMPTDLYRDTAGEIEARDAASRRTLTPEERINKAPDLGDENTVFAEDGKSYSISEITDESGKSYGRGVHLDSALLENLTDSERVQMVKEHVKELGGQHFTAYDNSGNEVDIQIAKPNIRFKNRAGKSKPVNKDLTTKYIGNKTKQEAVVLIDELIETANFDKSKAPLYSHDWLDNNGKNSWDYWTTFVQDRNGTLWEATLNIANTANNEKILYDINPIKKVGQSVKSDTSLLMTGQPENSGTSSVGGSIRSSSENVNKKFSMEAPIEDSNGRRLTNAQREFFKDSKAIDSNGRLLTLYHGTGAKFTVFDNAHIGENFGNRGGDLGFYFSPYIEDAKGYAREAAGHKGKGEVMPVYLNLKNPLIIEDDGWGSAISQADIRHGDLKRWAEEGKHDGIIVKSTDVIDENDMPDAVYIAFSPEQIKNVTNENPTSNPDIRYSREPERLNELRRQNERKLAQATAEDAANENERGLIRDYQKQYSKVEDIREKLSAAQQTLTEAEDSGADYDTTIKAKNRFTVLSNQYAREHRKLESYANMKALQNVLARVDERLGNDLPEGMGAASANFTGEETVGERWVTEAQGKGNSALHPISKEQEANLAEQQQRAPQEIPKEDLNGKLTSKHVSTIANSGMTPTEFSDALREDAALGKFSHIAYSDEEALKKANRTIEIDGWDQALANYKAEINSGRVSKDNTVMGIALYNNAVNSGDYATAMDIASLMVKNSTNTAQSLQAMRILNKLSPECRLYLAAKSIENIEEDLNKRYKDNKADIHVDKILYDEYAKALRQGDEDGIKTAWANIEQSVAQQINATWYEKLNNFRYLAMLGNPRTHVRNIVGNAFFVPVRAVKNTIAYGLENLADSKVNGGIERSKSILNRNNANDVALIKYAMSDYEAVQEVILSGGKYVDTFQGIDKHRTIYKTKILEAARKGNSAALDAEDAWFCKPAYANALAKWYKANGITAEQLNTGKVPEETIIKAQTTAIKEAQKATYRDTNWFSAQVSRLGKVDNKVAAMLIEGVLPFKKTPANILARAVEYSPVGLIKSLALDTKKVKAYVNGDVENGMSPAEFIDDISAGLTGSALMGLGILLASWGVLSGGEGDDDKQNYFDELSGKQNYALSIGGLSITLDWLAPESMPLFVGVELFNSLSNKNEDKGFLQNLMSSVMSLSTPMFEMSILQSVNDLFDNLAYIKQGQGTFKIVSSMAANYISQYFPTLFGQGERAFGETQRETTYVDRNSAVGSELQYMWGKIANKIPFYDFSQIPYIDAWGRTEETGNLFERMLNNFVNPAYVKKERPTEIDGELERLYDLGETSVYPSRAKTNTKINGEYLTADEYVKYATTKGQTSYELAQGVINSAAYSGAADPEKAYMLKYVYSYADHIAKYEVNNDYSLAKWEMAAYKSANPMQAIIDHAREYYNPDKEN